MGETYIQSITLTALLVPLSCLRDSNPQPLAANHNTTYILSTTYTNFTIGSFYLLALIVANHFYQEFYTDSRTLFSPNCMTSGLSFLGMLCTTYISPPAFVGSLVTSLELVPITPYIALYLLALRPVIVSRFLPNPGSQIDELLVFIFQLFLRNTELGTLFISKRKRWGINPLDKESES